VAAGNAEPPNAGTKTKVGVTRAQARSQAPKSAEPLASAVFRSWTSSVGGEGAIDESAALQRLGLTGDGRAG
jgi:hypothetical protein